MMDALRAIAPGSPLHNGLERILQANMGAIVVVGDGPEVLDVCSGGFLLDSEYSPQRLSELAKLDGAIILAGDGSRIARANVHLVPDPNLPTSETGTRHRTAERVARAIDVPVVAVSEDLNVITLYRGDHKHQLSSTPRLLGRANQALQTLERYCERLQTVSRALSALEVEDLVTVREVAVVLQRGEMVSRIAEEISGYIIELGTDGRLVSLQLDELGAGVEDERRLVVRDYLRDDSCEAADEALAALTNLSTESLQDVSMLTQVLRLHADDDPDGSISPRGYRLLARIPRVPENLARRLVERFGDLQKLLTASVADLQEVEGVDGTVAGAVKDGLARLAESSILDRYG